MKKQSAAKVDFTLSAKYGITLEDLGRQGCFEYVFNQAARERVDDLLKLMDIRCKPSGKNIFDQSAVAGWLRTPMESVYGREMKEPRSPLRIAACHPVLYKRLRRNVDSVLAGTP